MIRPAPEEPTNEEKVLSHQYTVRVKDSEHSSSSVSYYYYDLLVENRDLFVKQKFTSDCLVKGCVKSISVECWKSKKKIRNMNWVKIISGLENEVSYGSMAR